MPDDDAVPAPDLFGASNLPELARYLRASLTEHDVLHARAGQSNQYIVVHMYLVPGDVRERTALQHAVHTELTRIGGIRLHAHAYAVPTARGDEPAAAERAWNGLMTAGAIATGENDLDAWDAGDVIYIHLCGANGMEVLAVAPRAGGRLPEMPLR